MDTITHWITGITGLSQQLQSKIATTILIIFIFWLARTIIIRIVWKRTADVQMRYRWQKTSAYIATLLVLILAGRVWFQGVQALATYFGLLSAGLAIALRDLVSSLAGWVFIIWRSPLVVGDRIQVGEYRGDVIDIRLFKFTLLEIGNWVDADQSTGRIIHIPNSMILSDTLANYTRGFEFIWHEIAVLLTFESNWKKAKQILKEIAADHAEHLSESAEKKIRRASRKFMIFYKNLTPTVYTSVKDSGVMLTIRYLINPRQRRSSEERIWEEILELFAECKDIDFAYPTYRFYDNHTEGKAKTAKNEKPENII